MRAFFATNRETAGHGHYFGPGFQRQPDNFRVGWIDYDQDNLANDIPDHEEVYVAPERQVFDESTKRNRFSQVGSSKVFPALMEAMRQPQTGNGSDPTRVGGLVFIPGYNYTFLESVGRAAHLAHIYSTPSLKLVPIVFSWPSDGVLSPSAYISDRRDAENSGFAMARTFSLFLEIARRMRRAEECNAPLYLLAHSMGVYALRHAVIALSRPDFPRWPTSIFDGTILAAGDEDRDTLENTQKLESLHRLTSRIDVYINKNDKPVRLGDDVDGKTDRIGAYGPVDATIVERFAKPLSIVDCCDVDYWAQDLTRHQYYRMSPVVIEDIKDVLAGIAPTEAHHRIDTYRSDTRRYHLQINAHSNT